MQKIEFILYVKDQKASTSFYSNLLELEPCLNVPGMTEYELQPNVKLGIMPESGISKIIFPATKHPKEANGVPRCELYLEVNDAKDYLNRGLRLGAIMISEFQKRDWSDSVGYISDRDGHIIAFAEKDEPEQ